MMSNIPRKRFEMSAPIMKQLKMIKLIVFISLLCLCCGQHQGNKHNQLKIEYRGEAKIEVGGPFVGAEFHHSACLPQRISFYYPVANSIDISTDYWRRDTTFVMAAGLRFGDEKKIWLGRESLPISLTPYRVEFFKEDSTKDVRIVYQFAMTKPVFVISFIVRNKTAISQSLVIETHLETTLRTSHNFNRKNKTWTSYDPQTATVFTYHTETETGPVGLFVTNAEAKPVSFSTIGPLTNDLYFSDNPWPDGQKLIPAEFPAASATRMLYKKELAAGDSLKIVQIVGSTKADESVKVAGEIRHIYAQEIKAYEDYVLKKAFEDMSLDAGDPYLNHAAVWAKAIMAANEHYIDDWILPMPCPAEYNFYFTHDVLVSDLAAVHFDPARVKRDLDFIVKHARADSVIPHAYYWKDSTFVAEWADSDNWNNYWMIIATASYLRHAADLSFVKTIYPYLVKCLETGLKNKGPKHLMWTNRPDWWDIGRNYAPRAYMTILAIKAIREFIYISIVLDQHEMDLAVLTKTASDMQLALSTYLWQEENGYLMNYYEDGNIDPHYYIGSLLAVHYGLLDKLKQNELIKNAKSQLHDEEIGIYNAFPMDFAGLRDFLKFSGNEAGAQFYYFNGGIWPHGNAWFALALIREGLIEEATDFLKRIMTVRGIMDGPNGQPAMYEVRNSNRADHSVYGSVDKPQFMWAGAWYLYSLNYLLGFSEDHWNITLQENRTIQSEDVFYHSFLYGLPVEVREVGKGPALKKITMDDELLPSLVIPQSIASVKQIRLYRGESREHPYLISTAAALVSVQYNPDKNVLNLVMKAFPGCQNQSIIALHQEIDKIICDGSALINNWMISESESGLSLHLKTTHQKSVQDISVFFK